LDALLLCNCCEMNQANPSSSAGYCEPCERAARSGLRCEHERLDLRPLIAGGPWGSADDPLFRLAAHRYGNRASSELGLEEKRRAAVAVAIALAVMQRDVPIPLASGDRVVLVHTGDPHTRLVPGDWGTVIRKTESAVEVAWDSGSRLAMLPDAGDWIVLGFRRG
jgi:hypothetical protein